MKRKETDRNVGDPADWKVSGTAGWKGPVEEVIIFQIY